LNDLPPEPSRKAETHAPKAKNKGTKIAQIEAHLAERYNLRYNVIKNAVEAQAVDGGKWFDIDERFAKRIEAKLLHTGLTGVEKVLNVVLANVPEFDPVTDYLKRLPRWDGTSNHIGRLSSFVNVDKEGRAWFDLMFKKHLVRLLACATGRIPFNKQCLVLVSGQNDGKTSFLRYLCPPEWQEYYTEDIDFENKDGLVALARNLFINLDELRNLSKGDINKVKSYLSKDTVKARLPFDRRETKLNRRATFFGSTNNPEFLTDETGNVRWLVFEIQGIMHDNGGPNGYGANVDLAQVYAQAFALMQSPLFNFQLTKEEIEFSERINAAHTITLPEYELFVKHYDESLTEFRTATDIKQHLETVTGQRLNAVQVGKALRKARVPRVSRKVKGQVVHGYLVVETGEKDWAQATDQE
jgi:predicted P-loop ATPase